MSNIEKRKRLYKHATEEINKRDLMKLRVETKDYFCKDEGALLAIIEKLPNWESYLTDKQLEILKLYISYRNTTAIDIQLKLTNGVAYKTLFGNNKQGKTEGGAFKKLSRAYEVYKNIQLKKGVKINE